jgi:hypothetical protein
MGNMAEENRMEIAGMPGRALIDRAATMAGVLGHVRRDTHRADDTYPVVRVVPLSAPMVTRRVVNGSSPSITIAASGSAVPVAAVTAVSTMKPWRFSVSVVHCAALGKREHGG